MNEGLPEKAVDHPNEEVRVADSIQNMTRATMEVTLINFNFQIFHSSRKQLIKHDIHFKNKKRYKCYRFIALTTH